MTEFEEMVMEDISDWADNNLNAEYQQWRHQIAPQIIIERYWKEKLDGQRPVGNENSECIG